MIEMLGWIAMLCSWASLFLAGKYRWGWLGNAGVMFLWIPYGLIIGSWPVIVNTIAFSVIAMRNWFVWKDKDERSIN